MTDEKPIPTPELSLEEEAIVANLSEADLQAIDAAILGHSCDRWRKVAMVVAATMVSLEHRYPQLSDVFYARRICMLTEARRLESQGNIVYMRFSEVRLPASSLVDET